MAPYRGARFLHSLEGTIMTDRSSHRSIEANAQSAAAGPTCRKIGVPCHQDWVIPRPRLMERLKRAAQGPLTIVIGPPGAGKTVEATAWAVTGKTPGPVAWVSLSKADHSQDLFWPHVVAALRSVGVLGIPNPRAAGDEGVFHM